jgi:F-type H+-transporting ATPase subunit epsilon
MSDTKTFLLEIVSPERKVFGGNVEFAVFPGSEGEFGVLPNHAAMLSALAPGQIKIERDKKPDYFAASGGFLEVRSNKVTVIVETCEPAAEIDLERAVRAKEAAAKELLDKKDTLEISKARETLKKAEARIKVAAHAAGPDPAKH